MCRPWRGLGDGDVVAVDCRVFLDDDGIGAVGDDAAGENPHRLVGGDLLLERAAGRDLADHLQPRGELGGIGRAHRIAVHRRHRLRRLGAQRRDVAREHAMIGGIQRDHFLGQGLGAREDRAERIGNRHQGHGQFTPTSRIPENRSYCSDTAVSSERCQRLCHIVMRRHMNRSQAAGSRAFDIVGESSKNTMRAAGTPIAFTT